MPGRSVGSLQDEAGATPSAPCVQGRCGMGVGGGSEVLTWPVSQVWLSGGPE